MVLDSPSRRSLLGVGSAVVAGGLSSSLLATTGDAQSATSESTFTDWPLERCDPAGTGYDPDATGPGPTVREKWRVELDDFRGGRASPILVDDTLYVVGGGVAALGPERGDVRFHHEGPYRSSPAVAPAEAYTSETLVLAGARGYVGLNARGGRELFGRRVGFERWWQGGDEPEFSTFGPPTASPPVAVDGVVYVADASADRLAAVDPSNGREHWSTEVGRESYGGHPGRPAVLDGTLYVSYWPNSAAAYDTETGERLWRSEVKEQSVLPPTATAEGVLVPDRTGVTALDREDGSERWRYDHGGNVTDGAVAVAEGTVFVTSNTDERFVHAVDLETGEERWRTPNVAGETVPVVADGVVYVSARGYDELVAVDADTGDVHWRFEAEYGVGTPAVSDGVLFLAGGYRSVYALEAGR
ncbi:Outer membrane protein assembly factor BamB, contains PQQ-like beta-propeller repeat [Halogranum amylolyticum]|uniref:Outer membrane protein assembly factor BamB, contains PQQ-like beta-propeller repeat n=1 Tax=Halogranum amylolyticum TaxID=660520 RepID=A0A1H8SKL9_9EURY|nr:PQQ-binding-like beta-propeller repeat protein [Halogranum amylolyticum]SEO78904.1 Outer membrane protein assembly factor BamB, contains PQQ-like beta-propeller repeat [Halogranum amylolyticum]